MDDVMTAARMVPIDFDVAGARFSFLDPDGSVAAETLEGFVYEPATTALLARLLSHGAPTFLDVGAHYGYFTCFASALNPAARTLAFEPGARHFPVLEANIALNGIAAEPLKLALSTGAGKVPFTDRTMKPKPGHEIEYVETVAFDDYAGRRGIRADVVKIDVHGAEGLVLGGMARALRERIGHVLMEVHAEHILVGCDHAGIMAMLRDAGFHLYECARFRRTERPELVPLVGDAYEAMVTPSRWTDEQVKTERMVFASRAPFTF